MINSLLKVAFAGMLIAIAFSSTGKAYPSSCNNIAGYNNCIQQECIAQGIDPCSESCNYGAGGTSIQFCWQTYNADHTLGPMDCMTSYGQNGCMQGCVNNFNSCVNYCASSFC